MSDEKPKSPPRDRGAAGASPPTSERTSPEPVRVTRNSSGRVKFDERGNAVWEWAVTTGKFAADVSTSRLKKLENSTLSLAEDAPKPMELVKSNPKGVTQGYSPYDSGLLDKQHQPQAKKTDLKRLGEYYKLRQQATRNKRDPD